MTRDKIILGGCETWVEYDKSKCCITLFDSETAKNGVIIDVINHKWVNSFISRYAHLTEVEVKELEVYIKNKFA